MHGLVKLLAPPWEEMHDVRNVGLSAIRTCLLRGAISELTVLCRHHGLVHQAQCIMAEVRSPVTICIITETGLPCKLCSLQALQCITAHSFSLASW